MYEYFTTFPKQAAQSLLAYKNIYIFIVKHVLIRKLKNQPKIIFIKTNTVGQ